MYAIMSGWWTSSTAAKSRALNASSPFFISASRCAVRLVSVVADMMTPLLVGDTSIHGRDAGAADAGQRRAQSRQGEWFCLPARLPGGQLGTGSMGAIDTGGGAARRHHVGVAELLMPVMPGMLDRAGQLHVADPADLVGHAAVEADAGGLAHHAVRAVRADQVPRDVPGPAHLDACLIGGLPGRGHLGSIAHPPPRASRYTANACSVPHCGRVSVNGNGVSRPRRSSRSGSPA